MKHILTLLLILRSVSFAAISAPSNSTTNTFNSNTASTTITFPGAITVGSFLYLGTDVSAGSAWAVTGVSGCSSTWTQVNRAASVGHIAGEAWIAPNNLGSTACTVTASWNSGTNFIRGVMYVAEITGAATSSQPDGNQIGASFSASAASASLTPSQNNYLIMAVLARDGSASATAGTNYAIDKQASEGVSGTSIAVQYWVQTTATATTAPMTWTGNLNWAIVATAIKVAVANTAPPRLLTLGVGE